MSQARDRCSRRLKKAYSDRQKKDKDVEVVSRWTVGWGVVVEIIFQL